MKTRALVIMTIINSGFVLDSDAHAAELKVLSAIGMQSVMAKLARIRAG